MRNTADGIKQLLYSFTSGRFSDFDTSFGNFDFDVSYNFEFFNETDEVERIFFNSIIDREVDDDEYELNYENSPYIYASSSNFTNARISYNDAGIPYKLEVYDDFENTFIVLNEITYSTNGNPISICSRENNNYSNPLECYTLTFDTKKNPAKFLKGTTALPYSNHHLFAILRRPDVTSIFPGAYDNSVDFISINNPLTITDPEMNVVTFDYDYNEDGYPTKISASQINPSDLILEYQSQD